MKAFNGIVCVGVPTHHSSNLIYQSKTGLTQAKLVNALISDEIVHEAQVQAISTDCTWFEDLITTGLLLRKQYFKFPMYTTPVLPTN